MKAVSVMTNQEIFDTVVDHLRKQGSRSFDPHRGCMYRSSGGKKCAVGCLIPDDAYRRNLEGAPAYDYRVRKALGLSEAPHGAAKIELLSELQEIHDGTKVEEWEVGFRRAAIKFGIAYKLPNT